MRRDVGRTRILVLLVLLAAASSAACGDGPTAPDNPGRLAIQLTDAPIQDVTSVNVYIEGLKIKLTGEPEQRIASDVGLVDLLTLQDSTMLLVEATVEAGEYQYIMIELDEDRSNVIIGGAQEFGVRIPSEKIKVFGPFEVDEDGLTTVTLDFDAGESLMQLGNGAWLMTPIIVMLSAQTS